MKPFWKYQVVLFVLLMISNAAALASPYILKLFIDEVIPERNIDLLWTLVGSLGILYVLRVGVTFLADYLYTWIGNQVMINMSMSLFDHILRLPIQYFRQNSAGDLVHRIDKEVEQIQRALTGSLISALNNIITVIGLVLLMCYLSITLFLGICLLYPVLIAVLKRFEPAINRTINQLRQEQSDMLSYYTERFSNVKLIKSFLAYVHERSILSSKLKRLSQSYIREVVITSASKNSGVFLMSLMPIILLGWGGHQVLVGVLSLGTLIAFLQYANKIHDPFRNIINLYIDIVNTSVSLERVFSILEQKSDESDRDFRPLGQLEKIQFQNVSVSLGNQHILRNLNLEFKIGKHYGIAGASGAGKSTLLDVLSKFSAQDSGEVLVNDINLKEVSFSQWMQRLSMHSQNFLLFNGTIFENISYANNDIAEHEKREVLELTELEERYASAPQERTGDMGNHLSGGQRQRISLARAILKKADILIIDEGTSEIDSRTEEKIYSYVLTRSRFKTVIIVSHRLSALKNLDEILFIDSGKVAEQGSLSNLIARRGLFYETFKEQIDVNNSLNKAYESTVSTK
ncbi:MAG: ABC transporter ATP-binding protein [Cyclobacteriaceae bacterium]|nr:ABC transporter ATP-binding protein [Cyclobacteriaceae bacterium]